MGSGWLKSKGSGLGSLGSSGPVLWMILLITAVACTGGRVGVEPTVGLPSPGRPPAPATPRLPTATVEATVAPTPTVSAEAATSRPTAGLAVVGFGYGAPDDLYLDADGIVVFSDQGNSGVNELLPDGTLKVVARGFRVPEGVVVLPDGRLVVAEQGTNRLWIVDRSNGRRALLAEMPNATGKAGIDGLGYDRGSGDIIVPDSPNGRLLRLDPSTGQWRQMAEGFVRPTGAAVGPDGTVYVADEFGQGVYAVDASGRSRLVAQVSGVDDVALTDDGRLVMVLLDGRLLRREVDGVLTQLAKVAGPIHGIAVDRDGSIVFSDMRGNRILRLGP